MCKKFLAAVLFGVLAFSMSAAASIIVIENSATQIAPNEWGYNYSAFLTQDERADR